MIGPDGHVQAEVAVPGRQQEGVAVGPDGALWLADDQDKCLLRIDDALAGLQALLHPSARSRNVASAFARRLTAGGAEESSRGPVAPVQNTETAGGAEVAPEHRKLALLAPASAW